MTTSEALTGIVGMLVLLFGVSILWMSWDAGGRGRR